MAKELEDCSKCGPLGVQYLLRNARWRVECIHCGIHTKWADSMNNAGQIWNAKILNERSKTVDEDDRNFS